MGITDWDAWMKKRHIYIPTEEEAKRAIELGQKKAKATEASRQFEAHKKLAADSR